MASSIRVQDLTINPEEAREIGALIVEEGLVRGVLSDSHEIHTGIIAKTQIPFAGLIADGLKKASGCTPNPGGQVNLTQKYWEPEIFDVRFEHCAKDLNLLLKIFERAKKVNPDLYNRLGSQELALLTARIETMLRDTLPNKVWFSDKAAALIADGGNFKAGTDLDLYNVIDGLFKQIFAQATGSARVTITKNAAATYAAQALAADEAYGILETMFAQADSRLILDDTARFYVTRSMADNYRATLRNKSLGNGFVERVENGKAELLFEGRVLEVRHDWDAFIKANMDNGTKLNSPHRAIFTTPGNIPVGTLAEEDLETIESNYDAYRKVNFMDVAFSLDAKLLEKHMIVAAY